MNRPARYSSPGVGTIVELDILTRDEIGWLA
jgi:hypothetical protein